MDEPAEEVLTGGNLSRVVRIGDTVRRPAGPWTDIVHALLRHVRERGFDLAPEPLGTDAEGREVLRFIGGTTVGERHPWPEWAWSDKSLRQAADALRRYHDAVADFRPEHPIPSRLGTSNLKAGDIVCHNDFAPYNVVHRDGKIVGVFDWDIISAAPPITDVAFAAWQWVPFHNDDLTAELGAPPATDRPRRLAMLVDAYRLSDPVELVAAVLSRVAASRDGIIQRAATGDPPFIRLRDEGHADAMQATIDWIEEHRAVLQRAIA